VIIEIGHFAVALALAVALAQMALPIAAARLGNDALLRATSDAAVVQFVLLLAAFLALTHAFVVSDFTASLVAEHSHSTKPLVYRISGVWGNHEGSMLLWVLILALYGAAVAMFGQNLPVRLKAYVLGTQASITVAFLLFILLTSNPFTRLDPPPLDGQGLNPILQDPALALHPPFLYAGYVGLSICFSFAVAALIEGRIDARWARWVRPWTLAAWMFLSVGIAMGSWWAYYELGWGGWWFWDPVENASFMPWLAATALLHSAVVMEKRESLKVWTILLAILAFSLSLMGAFLVRSGVLSSVHAFAVDPARGVAILFILLLFVGGSLSLFAWRAQSLSSGGVFAPISREGSLVLNNILLTTACATVLMGTLYPLAAEAAGFTISVGAPYFNLTFVPLMIPLLIALPFGPMLAWKRGDLYAAAQRLTWVAAATGMATVTIYAVAYRGPVLAPLAMAVGIWVVLGALAELVYRTRLGTASLGDSMARLRGLPRSVLGTATAHFGVGVMVIGIVATSAWQSEKILAMKPGETTEIAGYQINFRGVAPERGPNWQAQVGQFEVKSGDHIVATLAPSKRVYDQPPQPTTEAGIWVSWRGDLYAVLGDPQPNGGFAVRLYFNPLVRLIWIGTIIMFLGGLLSLSDRRLRVGAPRRASGRRQVAAEAAE
jgi:cytochrome c-type biogenesis protein CcmF